MKDVYKILELDKYELGIIINALNEFRNKLIREKNETDFVDEVLLKVLDAPEKKRYFHRDHFAAGWWIKIMKLQVIFIWLGIYPSFGLDF